MLADFTADREFRPALKTFHDSIVKESIAYQTPFVQVRFGYAHKWMGSLVIFGVRLKCIAPLCSAEDF